MLQPRELTAMTRMQAAQRQELSKVGPHLMLMQTSSCSFGYSIRTKMQIRPINHLEHGEPRTMQLHCDLRCSIVADMLQMPRMRPAQVQKATNNLTPHANANQLHSAPVPAVYAPKMQIRPINHLRHAEPSTVQLHCDRRCSIVANMLKPHELTASHCHDEDAACTDVASS